MASEDNNQETNPQPAEAVAEAAPEMVQLQKDLEAAQAKTAEYLEGWQRSRADFANYKKRVEKEQAEAYQNAAARIIARNDSGGRVLIRFRLLFFDALFVICKIGARALPAFQILGRFGLSRFQVFLKLYHFWRGFGHRLGGL